MRGFYEDVSEPSRGEWIACHAFVEVDPEGRFVTVETDAYEGSAYMTLPVAKKALRALRKGIRFAEQRRKELKAKSQSSHKGQSTN